MHLFVLNGMSPASRSMEPLGTRIVCDLHPRRPLGLLGWRSTLKPIVERGKWKSAQYFRALRFAFAQKESGELTSYKTKKKTIFEILSLYFKRFRLVCGSNLSLKFKHCRFMRNSTYLRHRNSYILSLLWTKSCVAFRCKSIERF